MNSLTHTNRDDQGALTREKASQLLELDFINPFRSREEEEHPWAAGRFQVLDCPLLRIWDRYSGSQPKDNRMLSRSPDQRLDTLEARINSLSVHIDHRIWKPTPYISFSRSATAVEDLAAYRFSKRGDQKLTVINPTVRLRKGLPILEVANEMQHYGIPDPYGKGGKYYEEHYVCLWEITGDEIVCHYEWEELAKLPNWYDDVIMPDFRNHSIKKNASLDLKFASAFNMSTMRESLPGICDDSGLESFEDWDVASEKDGIYDYECTDSDDDVEEANRNDDIIKMIEGFY